MTLPRVLTIGPDGSVRQSPAAELEALRGEHDRFDSVELDAATRVFGTIDSDTIELRLHAKLDGAEAVVVHLRRSADGARSAPVRWDGRTLHVAGADVPLTSEADDGSIDLRIFLDRSVVEVYSGDGRVALTRVLTGPSDDRGLAVEAVGGRATIRALDAWRMYSIWTP
jgi:beta-fructofuranosidase